MMQSTSTVFQNIESLIAKSVREHIKLENEKILSVVAVLYHLGEEATLTQEESLSKIINEISKHRIGESGYSYAINTQGVMVAHPVEKYVGVDFSWDEGILNQIRQGKGYLEYDWKNPDEKNKRPKTLYMNRFEPLDLVISTTAYTDDPSIGNIRIEDVRQFLLNSPGLENSSTSLLNGKGLFLIKPEGISEEMGNQMSMVTYLDFMKESGRGQFIINNRKFPGFLNHWEVYFQYIPNLDWIIVTSGLSKDIYSLIFSMIFLSLIFVFLSVIVFIFFNNLISQRFSDPLNKLVDALDLSSRGGSTARSSLMTSDEFEILSLHFNSFIDAQEQYIGDLKAAQNSIKLLAKFPDENPSPVMRIGESNILEYANINAAQWILPELHLAVGEPVPEDVLNLMTRHDTLIGRNEVGIGDHIFSFTTSRIMEPDGLYLYGLDITRQKKFESLQLLSENIFRNSVEGIVITNKAGVIESINPAFTHITGYSEQEAIGQNPSILKSQKHNPGFYKKMWNQLLKKGYWDGEIWNRRKDGTLYPEYMTITSIRDEEGDIQNFISFFHDLTEVKEKEERIRYESTHDSLTELANKDYLYSKIEQAISLSAGTGFSIVYLDIRNLNRINESLGTDAGDAVLIECAGRLRELLPEGGTAARLGSDDFALLLLSPRGSAELQATLDRILKVFYSVFHVKGRDVDIRISLGVSAYPEDDLNSKELVAKAEMAMRSSKDNVNGSFMFYSPTMKSSGLSRVDLEANLRKAMEGELFYLHYQPKVDAHSALITGSEALVRMHPVDGHHIGPDLFISVAEEIGLIDALGAWVLEQACRDTRYLHERGYEDLSVAVNLSPWQFRREDLPQQIKSIVQSTGFRMDCLNLEITEGMAINNVEKSLEMMRMLTSLGLSLSIDDFGTGYSSLSYLADFPVDVLKIDKSFVKGIPQDDKISGIALAIISLAQNLGMITVAEGVETQEQLDFFKDKGCSLIQGYYFHNPLNLQEYERALEKNRS